MAHPTPAGALFLVVALTAGPAAAHPPSTPTAAAPTEAGSDWSQTLSLEELLQIELAAPTKQRQQAREAPGVASLVTREQIRQFGWTSLNDILFSQPGFFPSRDFERTVVGARGLTEGWNSNHLLLLMDGVPVNDHDSGVAYTWDITPLFLVRSVEIIRGPGSALYGSSAIHGVVAINTISSPRTLSEDERLEVNSEARLRFGSQGTAGLEAVAATRSEHLSAVLGFQYQRSDGASYLTYDGSGRTDESGALQRFQVSEPLGSRYLYIKLEPRKALEGLSLSYHQQFWEQGTVHGWAYWVPDAEEPLREGRHLAVLRYQSKSESDVQRELVLKFQRHVYDLDVRFLPGGALEGFYPAGVTESLQTHMDEVFGRAQLSGELAERLSLLGGVEYSVFLYGGDEVHYANAELLSEAFPPPPSQTPVPLGDIYADIIGHPVSNAAAYLQLTWSRLLGTPLSLTAGLRYDLKFFSAGEPVTVGAPSPRKTYDQLSPRLALVYAPTSSLSLKLQASQAFRAPAPSELFGANSWISSADFETIQPERVTTFDLNADWRLSRHLSWRTTVFHSQYENLIGYSDYQVRNLFSRRLAGLELELLADAELGERGRLLAFGNYTYVHLLGEADGEGGPVEPASRLTWAPEHTVKAGVSYALKRFTLALQGRYQSRVLRRELDRVTPAFMDARPESVPAWVHFDVNARLRLNEWSAVALSVTNVLDAESYLVKTGDLPFDYLMERRRIFGSLEINL
jgi:iron complex outermembrane receptor protein